MDIVKEIREYFASLPTPGARKIEALPDNYPAYVIRITEGYGVAIQADEKLEVSEKFNSVRLHTGIISINGQTGNYLILRSAFEEFRYEFASLCAEFVDPGNMGNNRKTLLADPYTWWAKWKELVGNTNRELRVYNVIAEMMVLDNKIQSDPTTEWAATRMGSHDIECAEESCEVKYFAASFSVPLFRSLVGGIAVNEITLKEHSTPVNSNNRIVTNETAKDKNGSNPFYHGELLLSGQKGNKEEPVDEQKAITSSIFI